MKTRFQKGTGRYTCVECGKQTRDTGHGEASVGMCRKCYEAAEDANFDLDHPTTPDVLPLSNDPSVQPTDAEWKARQVADAVLEQADEHYPPTDEELKAEWDAFVAMFADAPKPPVIRNDVSFNDRYAWDAEMMRPAVDLPDYDKED